MVAGTTLTATTTSGSGGAGTIEDQYRYSLDNGATWSVWDATVSSFAAVVGVNKIQSRRTATGPGCVESSYNEVSWTVNPAAHLWNGSISTDWQTAGNWTPSSVPTSTDDVIIPNGTPRYPLVVGLGQCKNLGIQNLANLVIGPTGQLTVHGTLANSAGVNGLTVQSTSAGTGSLLHNTDNIPGTIQRYVFGGLKHLTVSIPVTQAANPTLSVFQGKPVYQLTYPIHSWLYLGANPATPLTVDQGYMIYHNSTSPSTFIFQGPMNNGTFLPKAIADDCFQIIPNPYPSAIDWDAPTGWTKTNLLSPIWVWNPNFRNYATYNEGVGVLGGSRYIAVGQAFQVRSAGAGSFLDMNNNVRVHSAQPFLRSVETEQNILRILANGNDAADEIVLRFHTDASEEFDSRLDASKLYGAAGAPQMYYQLPGGYRLSINSLPDVSKLRNIPIGFEMSVSGLITMSFSGIETLETNNAIILTDLLTGNSINLRSEKEYVFNHQPSNNSLRFVLSFNSITGNDQPVDELVKVFAHGNTIHFSLPSTKEQAFNVEVFDIAGRKLAEKQLSAGNNTLTSDYKGVVLVRVVSGNKVYTNRLLLY